MISSKKSLLEQPTT